METPPALEPWPSYAPPPRTRTLKSVVWSTLVFQTILTGFLVFSVTTASIVIGGVLSEPLEIVFIALFAGVLTTAVFAVGLPLRLVPALRAWWFRRAFWTVALVLLALAGVVGSYFLGHAGPVHHSATRDWPASDGYNPDPALFLTSLALLSFTAMHVVPPLRRWRDLR